MTFMQPSLENFLDRPHESSKTAELAMWSFGTVATVLLSVAGLSGLSHASFTLWMTVLAVIFYSFAFWVSPANILPRKKLFAMSFIALVFLTGVFFQTRLPVKVSNAETQPRLKLQSLPAAGAASTKGENSPAVTGSGNTISYGTTEVADGQRGKSK